MRDEGKMAAAAAVREAREEAGLSQKELAAKVGVSYQTLSRWERGLDRIPAKRMGELSTILDVDLRKASGAGLNSREQNAVLAVAGEIGYERALELLTTKTFTKDAMTFTFLSARHQWHMDHLRLLHSLENNLTTASSKLKEASRREIEARILPIVQEAIVTATVGAEEYRGTLSQMRLMHAGLWP